MKLSKRIQAHTRSVELRWCKNEFMEMSSGWRRRRSATSKPMDHCFWCGHAFDDGEMMALARPMKGGNKVLCQKCAGEVDAENPS